VQANVAVERLHRDLHWGGHLSEKYWMALTAQSKVKSMTGGHMYLSMLSRICGYVCEAVVDGVVVKCVCACALMLVCFIVCFSKEI